MKKICFLVFALVMSYAAHSQQFVSGPKAKNTKIARVKLSNLNMMHDSAPASLHGPVAKNTEIWMEEPAKKLKVAFRDEIDNPQGLKAKNTNPWEKKFQVNTNSKAVYVEPKSMRPRKSWFH